MHLAMSSLWFYEIKCLWPIDNWFYFQRLPPVLSALDLWIWLSVTDRNLHYKYYQPFSLVHHSNIKYFSIGQQNWVAKLRQEGICTFLMLDLEFFSLYVGVTTVLLCDWTSLSFQNIENIGANFPLLKLGFLHYLIWWWGFDITILLKEHLGP